MPDLASLCERYRERPPSVAQTGIRPVKTSAQRVPKTGWCNSDPAIRRIILD